MTGAWERAARGAGIECNWMEEGRTEMDQSWEGVGLAALAYIMSYLPFPTKLKSLI